MDAPTVGLLAPLIVTSLLLGGISLWLHLKPGSLHSLQQRTSAVELELKDLHDKVVLWTKRDTVRRAREKREIAPDPLDILDPQFDAPQQLPQGVGGIIRGTRGKLLGGR